MALHWGPQKAPSSLSVCLPLHPRRLLMHFCCIVRRMDEFRPAFPAGEILIPCFTFFS
ncbi:hypothetical protein P175DRAFT_0504062 [Aspergillus ochraceoroseus IBT 24754]|uniref:Uncharacterized protein n=1 Tax=Aspergillus ochraceoroseus IBT 24754 TaxID=1392256 RepID=A0A2T5LPF3_9EURO|nr:uncharacterized protein P175DRAFT_0504062 [Aspergillus ochraceoroseus IBT 24754]PTU18159.1 hypothetical protein P175DRAFT_0504062 [Aspergillus ochraceoroseus IBT 24754]